MDDMPKKKKPFQSYPMPFTFGGEDNTAPPGWAVPMQSPPMQDTSQAAAPMQGLQAQNPAPTMPAGMSGQVMGLGTQNKALGQLQETLKDEDKYKPLAQEDYGSQKGGWARSIGNAVSDVAHSIAKKNLNDQISSSLTLLQAQQAQAAPGYLQSTYGIQPTPNVPPGQPTAPMSQGGLTTGGSGALSINNGPPPTPGSIFGFQ